MHINVVVIVLLVPNFDEGMYFCGYNYLGPGG